MPAPKVAAPSMMRARRIMVPGYLVEREPLVDIVNGDGLREILFIKWMVRMTIDVELSALAFALESSLFI